MKTLGQFMGGVAAWWSSWRQSVANDQAARRKVKTLEDRLEGCELLSGFSQYSPDEAFFTTTLFYKAPESGITLMVTKVHKL